MMTIEIYDIEAAETLGNAVIELTVIDYINALECLQKGFKSYRDTRSMTYFRADDMKKDCENFFKSDWCYRLTNIDGVKIMNAIRKNLNWDEEDYHE